MQRYAAERFLYRLGESPHQQRFILKGAMLLALWGGSLYRATRDLDLTGYTKDDPAGLVAIMREICAVPCLADGLGFETETIEVEPIRDKEEYHGFRVKLRALLGTARIRLQIDVGFGDSVEPPAREEEYPTLLDGPAPRVRAYPREVVVAEKLHAMVVLGEGNSRLKDFYDLYVLSHQFSFEGERLARAIVATFEHRRGEISAELPVALSPRFYADESRASRWRTYLTRDQLPGAPADFSAVGESLQRFLSPPWRALADREVFRRAWAPGGGPWQ
ncbi:MAG: nucleotidyl transferase AbiEii/AbiGii toxin family protein [Thermoanaerobaculia bacterium]|nr:nucleotidyl transferase AbiEii/AbiGii toxin family protein [Thermoanaerobaculia bacterium]